MFSSSEHYSDLIENITKEICVDRKQKANLLLAFLNPFPVLILFEFLHELTSIILLVNTASLKKVKLNIESLHSAKLKEEKALKSGKKSVKGKSVKMDLDKVEYVIRLLIQQITCIDLIFLVIFNSITNLSLQFYYRTFTVAVQGMVLMIWMTLCDNEEYSF